MAKIDKDSKNSKTIDPKKITRNTKRITTTTTIKKLKNVIDKTSSKKQIPDDEGLDANIFVSTNKLIESLHAVRVLQVSYEGKNIEKKALFSEESKFVHLQVELKKVTPNMSTFIHEVKLPNHWRTKVNQDTCLIVPDVYRNPLDDRDADLEATKMKYADILEAGNAADLIKDILPMRQLRNEFRPHQLKKRLSLEYGTFLCDRKLFRNKYDFLPRFIGKAFWIDHKKVPFMIDLSLTSEQLRPHIESKLDSVQIYLSGKGSSISVCIGSLEQSDEALLSNLKTLLSIIKEKFQNNVRTISIKTNRSISVTFYMDLGSSNDITLSQKHEHLSLPKFVEDDFDLEPNSTIRVYRDGNVSVIKNNNSNDTDSVEDDDDEVETQ